MHIRLGKAAEIRVRPILTKLFCNITTHFSYGRMLLHDTILKDDKLRLWLLHHAVIMSLRKTTSSLNMLYSSLSPEVAWNWCYRCWITLLDVFLLLSVATIVWQLVILRFYRASICEGGLGSRNSVRPSVRLSICLSVCLSHAWIVANVNDALQIFWYHTKGQSLCYSDTNSGFWATPPCLWNLRSKWPTLLRKTLTSTDFHLCLKRKKFNYDEYKVDHWLSSEL